MIKKKIKLMFEKFLGYTLYRISPDYQRTILISRSRPPYVVSQCGQSFKRYVSDNYMPEKLSKLKSELDVESQDCVDLIYERILNFPEYHLSKGFYVDQKLLQTKNEIEDFERFAQEESVIRNNIWFPEPLSECVFFYHHGLKLLDKTLRNYISEKDFLDVGSWIGDTALIMHQYKPRKVHSFDISSKVLERYKKVMFKNGISGDKFETVLTALGDSHEDVFVDFNDYEYSTSNNTFKSGENRVSQTTIDAYVSGNNLNVGVIQADIEGAELAMILGAKQTICTQRPVLLIDIYHRPDQFFELKPMIESWNLNYKFMIRSFKFKNLAISEVTLIAIPLI